MSKFTQDNTEGYEQADLDALNEALMHILDANAEAVTAMTDLERKSYEDHVSEKLLARFDAGKRGVEQLVRGY